MLQWQAKTSVLAAPKTKSQRHKPVDFYSMRRFQSEMKTDYYLLMVLGERKKKQTHSRAPNEKWIPIGAE